MLLSIVLPCYNVARWLPKCLDSIYNQKVANEDFLIVVVDDGSPDSSAEIAEKYSLQYGNLILVRKPNGGLASARNAGVSAARNAGAEYVWCIDPDDYISDGTFPVIIERLKKRDIDILYFSFNRVDENGRSLPPIKDVWKTSAETNAGKVMNNVEFMNKVMMNCTFAWNFVAHTQLYGGVICLIMNSSAQWKMRNLFHACC